MARLLLVDDQKNLRGILAMGMRHSGHEVDESGSGVDAVEMVGERAYDVVITDLMMQGMDGLEVVRRVKEVSPATEVVIMTAHGSIRSAVDAIKAGAYDYIQKPFEIEQLVMSVERALERGRLSRELELLKRRMRRTGPLSGIVGHDERFVDLLEYVRKISWTDGPVVITGESGTGKELFARAIHDLSPRAEQPFVVVNCGALPAELLESELFGHAKGAFTGAYRNKKGLLEEAVGGTVFLDEIGEMTLPTQAKMLRFLESGEIRRVGDNAVVSYDVRVVCATNRNLRTERDEKRFREDLYYRLKMFEISLPALRDRRTDVPLLVEHFREAFSERMNRPMPAFSGDATRKLIASSWPGNIRQLRNVVERALVVARGPEVVPDDVLLEDDEPAGGGPPRAPADHKVVQTLAERERDYILRSLERCDGSRKKASAELGISTATLWRKLKAYGES